MSPFVFPDPAGPILVIVSANREVSVACLFVLIFICIKTKKQTTDNFWMALIKFNSPIKDDNHNIPTEYRVHKNKYKELNY